MAGLDRMIAALKERRDRLTIAIAVLEDETKETRGKRAVSTVERALGMMNGHAHTSAAPGKRSQWKRGKRGGPGSTSAVVASLLTDTPRMPSDLHAAIGEPQLTRSAVAAALYGLRQKKQAKHVKGKGWVKA